MRHSLLVLLLLVALLAVSAPAQSPAVPARTDAPAAGAGGRGEVVLDFVARDSHSHPVRDLRPEEIKITDGGATVKIERLQLVGGSSGQQAPAASRFVSL